MKAYATPMANLLYVESTDVITGSPFMGLFENSDGLSIGSGDSISFDDWAK